MTILNRTVLYVERFVKRVNHKLSVLTIKGGRHEETFGGVGYVYYLDCEDGFMCVYICSSPSSCIH